MIYRRQDHCKACGYYLGDRTCKAFTEQIPDDLWQGDNLHLEPVGGDQGYRFLSLPYVHLPLPPGYG